VYSTCLFCHSSLGANEVIERLPIGRRLAFDAAKGRLWVVCGKCAGWSLTPLEERWEAIEECERRFRGTRLRVSTDHIGLTKLNEGLELVRIGSALRPEFALWRYGQRLVQRRWRAAATATATGGGMILGGLYSTLGHLGFMPMLAGGATGTLVIQTMNAWRFYWHNVHVACRVHNSSGGAVAVTEAQAHRADIESADGLGAWRLVIPSRRSNSFMPMPWTWWRGDSEISLTGPAAVRAVGMILPHINRWGASRDGIRAAASLLERYDVDSLCRQVATSQEPWPVRQLTLKELGPSTRLALEMAAHEETERRAMEGELAELEAAWGDAEEIAAIADNMFLPQFVTEFIERRGRAASSHDEPIER
jgi:hypothetical protein